MARARRPPSLFRPIGRTLSGEPVINLPEVRSMGEGERRAGGVQAAAYEKQPLMSPPGALQSLEAIFREHHGAVYRAAYRITGNAADAEDVLQTVFTRL